MQVPLVCYCIEASECCVQVSGGEFESMDFVALSKYYYLLLILWCTLKNKSNQTAFYWNRWLAKIISIGRSFSKDWMVYSCSYFLYFLGYNLLEIMTSKYCSIPWNMSNVSTLKPLQIFYDFKFPVLALFLAFLLDFNFIRNDHISDHISQCPMLLALLISLSIPTPTF